jgi:hypothetical protein
VEITSLLVLAPLADGGVSLVAQLSTGAMIGEESFPAPPLQPFVARFSSQLELQSLHTKLPGAVTALGADGSVVVAPPLLEVSLTLGAGEPTEATFTNQDKARDVVVARYDADGALMWARQIAASVSGIGAERLFSLADGTTWVVVTYVDTAIAAAGAKVVVAPGTPQELSLDVGGQAALLLRFSPSGEPAWGIPFAIDTGSGWTEAAASASSLIVGGDFQSHISFGSPAQELDSTADAGKRSGFIAEIGP